MPVYYDLIKDFGKDPRHVSVTPAWVLYVVPFKNQVTTNRALLGKAGVQDVSRNASDHAAIEEAEAKLVLGPEDCIQLTTESDKATHTIGMQAVLTSSRDLLQFIHPGDWAAAWIVNSEDKARDLISRLSKPTPDPCNHFDDGLKFLGRVENVRKTWAIAPDGRRDITYTVSAHGFTEMDASILFYQEMEKQESAASAWFHKLDRFINDLLAQSGELEVNKLIPTLVQVLLGSGPRKEDSPNGAFLIPNSIARILGTKGSSRGTYNYADILEGVLGIQHYRNASNTYKAFIPQLGGGGPFYRTPTPLIGHFLPTPPSFNYTPVWSILRTYLNPALNEMYTALRVNPQGKVVPQLIVRQLPFQTPASRLSKPHTKFHELPRWRLHDTLLVSGNVGTTDASRFNYVHLSGLTEGIQVNNQKVLHFALAHPIWDNEDVKRSGLRAHDQTVNCSLSEATTGPKAWIPPVADFVFGQHLTYNGSFVLKGIQAPICHGDNLEHNGIVYHIECVSHAASIGPNGSREFTTTLHVSNGMSSEETMKDARSRHLSESEAMYPCLSGATPVTAATSSSKRGA